MKIDWRRIGDVTRASALLAARKLVRKGCFLAQRSVPSLMRANDRIWVRFGCCKPYRAFLNLPLHCYAYRRMNDLAQFMRTSNPKVGGSKSSSQPSQHTCNNELHEYEAGQQTTFPPSLTRCPSPPQGVVCPACLRTSHPFPTSAPNPVPTTRKL